MGVNAASRFAAMQALVEQGTWAIDDTTLVGRTVDKVFWDGHFYSSKPPLLMAIGALFYAPLHALFGVSLTADAFGAASVLRIPLAVLPALLGLWAFGRILDWTCPDRMARLWGFAAWGLASLPVAYGSHLTNHGPAVAALLGGLLAAAPLLGHDVVSRRRALAGGCLTGLAVALDLGAAPTAGMLSLAVAWQLRRRPALVGLWVLGALAAPLAQAALQWQIAGTPTPFYLLPSAYEYPGSYWLNPGGVDALREPKSVYALNALIGHHGLLSITPWLAFGCIELLRRPSRDAASLARGAALVATVFTVGYYVLRTNNYGGLCVGMRWFLVLHPALALAAVAWVARNDALRRHPWLCSIPVGWAAASALTAAINPFEDGLVHVILRAIGLDS